jgi:hypothetical protein
MVYTPGDVWFGGSNVDATNGFKIPADTTVTFTNDGGGLPASVEWYGYAASATTVQITEIR